MKLVWLYIKRHKEINECYAYGVNEGYIQDETFNWLDRTKYWLFCLSAE